MRTSNIVAVIQLLFRGMIVGGDEVCYVIEGTRDSVLGAMRGLVLCQTQLSKNDLIKCSKSCCSNLVQVSSLTGTEFAIHVLLCSQRKLLCFVEGWIRFEVALDTTRPGARQHTARIRSLGSRFRKQEQAPFQFHICTTKRSATFASHLIS